MLKKDENRIVYRTVGERRIPTRQSAEEAIRNTGKQHRHGKRRNHNRRERNPRLKWIIGAAAVAAVIIIIALLMNLPLNAAASAAGDDRMVEIRIEKGMGASRIASLLMDENVIYDADAFVAYLQSGDLTSSLKAGEYIMRTGSSFDEVRNVLVSQNHDMLIIPPGYTIDDVDEMLSVRKIFRRGEFNLACRDLQDEYDLDFVEGYLLADSYPLDSFSTPDELVHIMYFRMLDLLSSLSGSIGGRSMNDIVKVATMIQAETQNVQQMGLISSVIYNRLEADMPLGIDATTRYELDDWTEEIPRSALESMTPYNTRRRKGNIPTGICCPSSDAIYFAFAPEKTDYLYYIHQKDGSIVMAKNYDEHLENIERRDSSGLGF